MATRTLRYAMIRHDLKPTGKFVGTGVNRKTAARPEYQAKRAAPSTNYTRQAEQFTRSAPEPFRNPVQSADPRQVPTSDDGWPYASPAPSLRPGSWQRAQPQRQPHSKEEINRATGHAAGYTPAGYTELTSGFPTGRRKMKTNLDIFGPQTQRLWEHDHGTIATNQKGGRWPDLGNKGRR